MRTLDKTDVLRKLPTRLLRHYRGPISGRIYKQLETTIRSSGVRITWADIEWERARRKVR